MSPEGRALTRQRVVRQKCPHNEAIDLIIDALQKQYPFHFDLVHIKTWWKVGGFYPFITMIPKDELADLDTDAKVKREKTAFVIMALLTEECEGSLYDLTTEQLNN
ncbi:hypothetical protein MIH18_23005 (plasmid) [Marinobacter sp. M3C]|jgi:hypothetical protein|uniref:hypothetical protein n=1 Tax=Marinobacter sp. M3C TaxID=2917715 RepID=UPI00200D0C3C|nr:hypothetical protein [Marinobacter sp. M3C]UQG62600.1 hypothetical protein MIH18_23005 [Marinobacter sp. M3C]